MRRRAFRRSIEFPTDETVRARFALYPSQYCEAPDHLQTTLRNPSISITA
jgi:hypothetical protein